MRLRLGIALIGTAALLACNGWPHPRELKEAKNHPEKYPTYAASSAQPNQAFTFQNRRFVITPAVVDLHAAYMQEVGTAAGMAIYAPAGEQAPYTHLYTSVGGTRFRAVEPID